MIANRIARAAAVLSVLAAMSTRPVEAAWAPPIGIPAPSFGINEVAPATPNPWTVSTPGFYYVEPTKAGATDTSNTYGTPARPRRTIPWLLPAGSVVELHGIYDTPHSSPATIVSEGTAARPVFIRGVSATNRPLARRGWEVKGTYAIVENIEFGPVPDLSVTGAMVILLPSSHIALRNSDLHGTPVDGGLGIVNWEVGYGEVYNGPGVIDNVVIYNNTIHDNGNLDATFDQDVHGISVTDHVNHLWVVDNQMYRNSGDGIQIVAPAPGQAGTTHHIYVGRNVSHHNKQAGFWVKQATDVIFSQNTSYGHRPSNSSMGQCIGGQYAPDWVWFLYNHLYDCEYGVAVMSDNGEVSHTFVIGNIIHDIHRTISDNSADDAWGPAAIMMSGGYERHVINNTIYNVDAGVNIATPVGSMEVADNIIGMVTLMGASHLNVAFATLGTNTTFHHNLLYGTPRIDLGNGQMRPTASQLALAQSLMSDPQFLNPAAGDFHTAATSPVANHAEFNSAHATFLQRYGVSIAFDADGNVRPQSATTDMGAYLSAGPLNQPPAISTVAGVVINEDTSTGALAFTVSDVETAATSLTVVGASSNTALVPNTNVVVAGSATARTVTVTPAPNMSGTTLITLTVNDGVRTNSTMFLLTVNAVNDAPTISSIANQVTTVNGAKGPLAFTVNDIETAPGSLYVWATSSNTAVVPNSNILLGGSGTNRTVTVVPALGKRGKTTITVTVSDGGLTAVTAFLFTTNPIEGDYDGDGKTDIAVFRPSTGVWYIDNSSTAYGLSYTWGGAGDIPVPGDYDGDGKADIAVFRPSTGMWYIVNSSTAFGLSYTWGGPGDIPVPGDYDGDGKADIAVFRPSTGVWYIINSSTGFGLSYTWGGPGDIPVPGDYDGDGKADIAVFRPSTGVWYIINSSTAFGLSYTWGGGAGDIPVPGDYDGDGKTDIAVFRPSTGVWYIVNSSTAFGLSYTWGGGAGDIPVPGDYDGDGKVDIAVFRPSTGTWYIVKSSTATGVVFTWGGGGDIPS